MQTAQNTQKQRILEALKVGPVPMWKMIAPRSMGGLSIGQYNARVLELRREGYNILNKTDENGYTYFELQDKKSMEENIKQIFGIKDEPKQESLGI